MRLARLLPERWQKLLHEALKFGLVGAMNTVVNFAVFNALILTIFANGQLKANVIATLVALSLSFFLNRHWTYRDRPRSALRREYLLFFFFNGAGLTIELGVLGLTKYGLGLESVMAINAAKLLGVVLGTVFRFWSYRTFVFRPERVAVAAAAPPPRPLETPLDLELEIELATAELDAAARRPGAN
ncbi:MAG TPA: GtrA family protein [Micromonosporaceae bacterium]|jgi:putative flippase GtrA